MTSRKFFEDNITRISPSSDPVMHNLNCGLLELSKEIQRLSTRQEQVQHDLRQLANHVRQLPTR